MRNKFLKYILISGLIIALVCGTALATVTKVKSKWDSGNLIFYEDPDNRGGQLIFGEDDDGLDVKFFGATSGAYMFWDESADDLILAGVAELVMSGTPTQHILVSGNATDEYKSTSTSTRALMLAGTYESAVKVEGGTWRRGLMLKETLDARPSPAGDDSLWGIQTTLTHQIDEATAHFIGESIHLIKDVGDCWQVLPFEGALAVSQVVTRVGGLSLEFSITAQPDGAEGYWPYTSDGVYFGIYIYQNIANTIEGQAAIAINDDWDAAIRVDPTEITNLINFNGASGCFATGAFTNDTGAFTGAAIDGYFTIDANGTQAKVPFWYDD